jgi:hypothetical protein
MQTVGPSQALLIPYTISHESYLGHQSKKVYTRRHYPPGWPRVVLRVGYSDLVHTRGPHLKPSLGARSKLIARGIPTMCFAEEIAAGLMKVHPDSARDITSLAPGKHCPELVDIAYVVKLRIALPSHGIFKDFEALFGLSQHTLPLLTSEIQREVTAALPQGFSVAYAGPLVTDIHTSRTLYHTHPHTYYTPTHIRRISGCGRTVAGGVICNDKGECSITFP